MKSFTKLAFAGISGVVLFKLFATILLPLVGMMFGLIAITVKLALIAAVVFFVYSMLKKREDADGESVDGEIVVEAEEIEEEEEDEE